MLFCSTQTQQKKMLSLVGSDAYVVNNNLHETNFTLILFTNLKNPERPFEYTISPDNNSSESMITFIIALVELGVFLPGEILILDNAPIHSSDETLAFISDMRFQGYHILFQPAYSPEFNACEFIFNYIKNQCCASSGSSISDQIHRILNRVTFEMVVDWYLKVIDIDQNSIYQFYSGRSFETIENLLELLRRNDSNQ